ncbi:hypothetical protein DEO72_LG10g3320 [Vigna unguiculata]|uniref:Uncharacterized protein n=1 Tax=Vigna unguiculata TaxID=3917 RepID=A0A4D6NE02_VIGUN|nr:hypothetical protein DEO72_LG10g3319 [Vigna unguiculata]QCE12080.1 hypothetical protein DEO72_LG10g3320 [Vigna unguiculata]
MLSEDVLCENILLEILSRLRVKSLKRFMCVNKFFQSLILDPCFVTMHLQNSRKNTNFLLKYLDGDKTSRSVIAPPINSLFEDSNPLFLDIHGSTLQRNKYQVIGSCNGLVCLAIWRNRKGPSMFQLWNPATKKYVTYPNSSLKVFKEEKVAMLGFGYDNSTHTYKVVAIVSHMDSKYSRSFRSVICSLNDESNWRDIQNFPVNPAGVEANGIYLNNTINWLGRPNSNDSKYHSYVRFDKVVIASLDLETETYTEMLLPHELKGVFIRHLCFPCGQLHCNEVPLIGVLSGCLSLFLRNRETRHLSIWQIKEIENQKSWILLLNISFHDLGVNTIPTKFDHEYDLWTTLRVDQHFFCSDNNLLPLCMVENDRDIVIIRSSFQGHVKQTIIYNLRDETVIVRKMAANLRWIYPFDYVESLVSPIGSTRT